MDRVLEALYLDTLEQHYNKIKLFCAYHLHRNPHLVEDCCQEVFRLYLEALVKGRKIENVGAWLRKVAYSEIIRLERDAAKQWSLELLEDSGGSVTDNKLVVNYDYIDEIIKNKFTDDELIQVLIEPLSEEEKYLFDRCFIHPHPSEELAHELHITINNLYQKKWALKKKLLRRVPKLIAEIEDKALKK